MIEVIARKLIFLLLLAVAPGYVFLIQVAAIYPPLLTLSIVFSGLGTQLAGISQMNYAITGLSLAQFMIFSIIYWCASFVLGKLVTFFQRPSTALIVLVLIAFCILCVSQLSLYGSGGHGPSQLGPLQSLFFGSQDLPANSASIYLGFVFLSLILILALGKFRAGNLKSSVT
jgi:hypothetical protein